MTLYIGGFGHAGMCKHIVAAMRTMVELEPLALSLSLMFL